MARIQPNTAPDAKSQDFLAGVKKSLGGTPNLFMTMAHSSATLGVYLGSVGALSTSSLSGALREQIALAVAGANQCDYCASAHTTLGRMNKIPEAELSQNLQSKSTDAKTQAALTFARRIVEARGRISDGELAAVRTAGYSDSEIVDIITVTCVNIFTNYFNHIAGTEVDFPLVSTDGLTKAA